MTPAQSIAAIIGHEPAPGDTLLVASHSPGGIARFARRHNITRQMADSRLYRLRQQQKRKVARNGREA